MNLSATTDFTPLCIEYISMTFFSHDLVDLLQNSLCLLVQWPTQSFKGDVDIDYVWVFISN